MSTETISLSQYNKRISSAINNDASLSDVWVTAETSDVRVSGGHCYLELMEKHPDTGRQMAKIRATIWASTFYRIAAKFRMATGRDFGSDIKVMVLVSANYHPIYGLSLCINDINPAFTMGDLLQRRAEMIHRLQQEGVIDMNRELEFPLVPQRIAVISAKGAAGYGDFINQLCNNRSRIRFAVDLYPAVLQGERTAPSIIAALEQIADRSDDYDAVVIIRGGGATSDLQAFENYDLASNIAQFPLPVIIGIGHERDVTLLDYVAKMRVKTPTAAAQWLIGCGERLLSHLQSTATAMLQAVTDRLSGCHQQLSYIAGKLPAAANSAVVKAQSRLLNARVALSSVADRRLRPELSKIDSRQQSLVQALNFALVRSRQRIDGYGQLIQALSPEATLKRGYTITRIAGKAVKNIDDIRPGEIIETVMCGGSVMSNVVTSKKD